MVSGMAELSKLQQAMAYQALYGALGPVVKAGGDGLRGEVDRELREIYERTGAKTYKVQVGGVQLGTYSVVESKAEPAHVEAVLDLVDEGDFEEWCDSVEGRDMARWFAAEHAQQFAEWCVSEGVMPDGVARREVEVPAKPAAYKGGQIRVDRAFAEEVRRRMDAGLAALVAPASALIGDGS